MVLRGTDPESYITEYALVYDDKTLQVVPSSLGGSSRFAAYDDGDDNAVHDQLQLLLVFFFMTLTPRAE